MKKYLALVFMILLLSVCAAALADVPVNEANFPDAAFRTYVLNQLDLNRNGTLEQTEIDNVEAINVRGLHIGSLEGIAHFPALEILYAEGNELTHVDLSGNTRLVALNFDLNSLESLDVSMLRNLEQLLCHENKLRELRLDTNTNLKELDCGQNDIERLDLRSNMRLNSLNCSSNMPLSFLDVSQCHDLIELDCGFSGLPALDITGCIQLVRVIASYTRITELDVSMNRVLNELVLKSVRTYQGGSEYFGWGRDEDNDGIPDVCVFVDDSVAVKTSEGVIPGGGEPAPAVPSAGGALLSLNEENFTADVIGAEGENTSEINIPAVYTDGDGMSYRIIGIQEDAFRNNKKIKKVTLGKNVAVIGMNAFSGCKKLQSVSGGKGLTHIGAGAFRKCTALKAFTLEKKVVKIYDNAFNGCSALKTVTVKTTKLRDGDIGKKAFANINKKATIKCPKKQLNLYRRLFRQAGAKTAAFSY